jgi:signal transduction histidine kinase
VAELLVRLTASSTVRVGLAAAPVTHHGVTVPAALLMCAFCLLATVPAAVLRPVPAAVAVGLAAVLSLVLFELVTVAGAAALLLVAYRLARAGARVFAVALGAPFLAVAVALAANASGTWGVPVAGRAAALAAAGTETRVLAVLLASAIPVAAVAAMARGAHEESRTHRTAREITEAIAHDHLARGERARIARELHDVVAHHVSVMVVQADGAGYALQTDPDRAEAALQAIANTGRQALTEMRRLLGVLRSADEQATLAPVPGIDELRELLDQARTAGLEVSYTMTGTPRELSEGVELAAYRVVQESLTNTRKHAGLAATAAVTLRYEADGLTVEVTDDGLGVVNSEDSGGHGLAGMRERIAMYGGTVTAGPLPGGGFGVTARLPCPQGGLSRAALPAAEPADPDSAAPGPADLDSVGPVPAGTVRVATVRVDTVPDPGPDAAIPVTWSPDPSVSGGVR